MDKWKQLLTHNLGLKLLSLLLAFALWIMVINNENPVESRAYTVAITYQNQAAVTEAGMQVENMAELAATRVVIRVRGPRISLDRLSAAKEKIAATVDLSRALAAGDFSQAVSVPVDVNLNVSNSDSLYVDSRTPSAVLVELEYLQTVEMPVQVQVEGTSAEGYQMQEPAVAPATVSLTGGASEVAQVSQVVAQVTVDALKEEQVYLVQLEARDAAGQAVEGITLDPAYANVTLRSDELREVSLTAQTSGEVAEGYLVESVTADPATVWVTGTQEALAGLFSLELPALDVTGERSNVERSFSLRTLLPEGVSLTQSSRANVTVTVRIEAATDQTVTLPEGNITPQLELAEGLTAEYDLTGVTLSLRGGRQEMEDLNPESLTARLALAAQTDGVYEAPLVVDLPEGVTLLTAPTVTVVVSRTDAAGE